MHDDYTLDPELYDIVYADYDPDMEFYVEEARNADGPVLELGCGTGRILIPSAEAGATIIGVDSSRAMLDRALHKVNALPPDVQRRIGLVKGDMRSFRFDEQFALITIPFRAFLHLLQVSDQIVTLRNIHRHLREDGRLVLNFFDPSMEYIVGHSGPIGGALHATGESFVDSRSGNLLIEWATVSYNRELQRIDQYFVYDELDASGRVVGRLYRNLRLRYIFRWEFEHLLARCGFEVESLYGTFDRRPHLQSGQELIWVARPVSLGS